MPWIHNVRNLDAVIAVDDNDCMNLLRLFNEPDGKALLSSRGVPGSSSNPFPLLGISGIGNLLASIKLARTTRWRRTRGRDLLTDSMQLYESRLRELTEQEGAFDKPAAVRARAISLEGQRGTCVLELTTRKKSACIT